MSRLDDLRVLMEGYMAGEGLSMYKKALQAYNKQDNFTGIIRLTKLEKEFLSYRYDAEYVEDPSAYKYKNEWSAKCLLFYMGPEYGQNFMSLSEYKKAIAGY